MFNISEAKEVITNKIYNHFNEARKEIYEELTSDGYSHIIESFEIVGEFTLSFVFKKGISIEKQDFLEVLAQGGALYNEETGDYILIKPSRVIKKYLGKR